MVVIFVIFVVGLVVMKFSRVHARKLMPIIICESMMMGVATNWHRGSACSQH